MNKLTAIILALSPLVAEANNPQPIGTIQKETVDLIEYHNYLNLSKECNTVGNIFDQVVFYDRDHRGQYIVRDWKLAKPATATVTNEFSSGRGTMAKNHKWVESECVSLYPRYNYRTKMWQVMWDEDGITKIVESKFIRETRSSTDPERDNQNILPSEEREPLFPPTCINE